MANDEAPDPLLLQPHGLDFAALDGLRRYLERVSRHAVASMEEYYDPASGGFAHTIDPGDPQQARRFSKASTATCLAFLGATGLIDEGPWNGSREQLRTLMVKVPWRSAGLDTNNHFTVSFMLEALHTLGGDHELDRPQRNKVNARLRALNRALTDGDGGLKIEPYEPTAFLTHKAVRVLQAWKRLTPDAHSAAQAWSWRRLHEESVLVASRDADLDVFELAYAVLTAARLTPRDRMSPQERSLVQYALDQFFDRQKDDDGTWPRSRPLFLYPDIGYAYCFDYELLVDLLAAPQLAPQVFAKLENLRRAALALDAKKFALSTGGYGWSSGHHGRRRLAESWSTASALHYCFNLSRVVAEALRRVVFDYAGATYDPPDLQRSPEVDVPASFLDSPVLGTKGSSTLKTVLRDHFLTPLVDGLPAVRQGRAFPKTAPISAILYGPPGTSKTQLAKLIAQALSWPLLPLDPSHLTRRGLDRVHAEADRLFGMLKSCDAIVVLLDEFDELVREREEEGAMESRFLTTAMLPKLADLSNRRRIVYLLATNHLERFDVAIRRQGRFDLILPVMPPTSDAKLDHFAALRQAFDAFASGAGERDIKFTRERLEDLTYLETEELDRRLAAGSEEGFVDALQRIHATSTLSQSVGGGGNAPTWKSRLEDERSKIRIRGLEI